jgi:hypothetical protein
MQMTVVSLLRSDRKTKQLQYKINAAVRMADVKNVRNR